METLDLHGIKHENVDVLVENFVLLNEPPLRIITGNSPAMKAIVMSILEKYEFSWEYENDFNLGSLIVFF